MSDMKVQRVTMPFETGREKRQKKKIIEAGSKGI